MPRLARPKPLATFIDPAIRPTEAAQRFIDERFPGAGRKVWGRVEGGWHFAKYWGAFDLTGGYERYELRCDGSGRWEVWNV